MNISENTLEKAKTAASAEELLKIAAEEGVELSKEDAEKYFLFLSGSGELPDEALEAVAGGKGHSKAQYKVNDHVRFLMGDEYLTGKITKAQYVDLQGAWYYTTKADDGQVYHGEVLYGKSWDLALELPVFQTTVLPN